MDSSKAVRMMKALVCASLVFAAPGQADETNYSVSVIRDAAHGQLVLEGEYEAAIQNLGESEAVGLEAFYASTNLCVAYLKTGKVTMAKESCDAAVAEIESALQIRETSYGLFTATSRQRRAFLAIALTNRGVVQAMAGQESLAEADFLAAIDIRSRLNQPERNLEHFTQMASLAE